MLDSISIYRHICPLWEASNAKAERIRRHNLGTVKKDRRARSWMTRVRTETFTAVHRVVDKAAVAPRGEADRSGTADRHRTRLLVQDSSRHPAAESELSELLRCER